MKSAAYDFLGVMIDSFTNNNSRKSSLALSTWLKINKCCSIYQKN
jgi:hypothetical protein